MRCPNCNGEIGRFELSPNCKHCGVNIFYSQQKNLLTEDAKKCELEYATFRILVAKLKTTFIGSKIVIFRIVAMVMAIGAIFVPFANVSVNTELFASSFSFGAWGIYSAFSDGTLGAVFQLLGYMPKESGACILLLCLIVAIFLSGLGIFVTLLLSFINIQKSAKVMEGFCVVGMALSIAAAVLSFMMPSIMAESGFLVGSAGFGAIACFIVLGFIFILNYLVRRKNIQPEIKEVDLKRIELRKKLKAGEVSLDELTLPVFETEEEKQARLKAEEESRVLAQKGKAGDGLGK